MIKYKSGSFGFSILFRVHGSAVFKALSPSVLSSIIFIILYYTTDVTADGDPLLTHPYPIGALIAALTFLLAFRANFSYNRWWESMSAVHAMHSKWLDVGTEMAALHLQSPRYDRPPAFGSHPELTCLVDRKRERLNAVTLQQLEQKLDEMQKKETEAQEAARREASPSKLGLFRRRRPRRREPTLGGDEIDEEIPRVPTREDATPAVSDTNTTVNSTTPPLSIEEKQRYMAQQGNRRHGKSINATKPTFFRFPFAKQRLERGASATLKTVQRPVAAWDQPPLFLQEAAHLLSLLSAVAMSTLRNDLEQADSPLIAFTPGAPWPHVDPDDYGADVRKDWKSSRHSAVIRYLFGVSRTPKMRTLYNAARPFRVIGGVSDAEIELLQAARGPLAKVSLVSFWLQEFISREYLAGSTGPVAPPIVSRLYQFVSDGMVGYNQARKVAYIPFPFPHAQICSLFVLIACAILPILMLTYLKDPAFGLVINGLTVLCFCGLHEVARELEAPFQNVPNDVPLNNFQAQFNEALITMFFGPHPDAYWEVQEKDEEDEEETDHEPGESTASLVVTKDLVTAEPEVVATMGST